MTKIRRLLRGFSLVDFSPVGFLGLFKTSKTQRQKVMFLYKSDFTGKAMHFYGLISKLVVLHTGRKCIVAMFSCLRQKAKKKFTTRGAMSLVKLIAKTSVYICHENVKSIRVLQFFESFRGKIYNKYSIGNEERIEFEIETITSDYVEHNHLSIS